MLKHFVNTLIYKPPDPKIRNLEKQVIDRIVVHKYKDLTYSFYTASNEELYSVTNISETETKLLIRVLFLHGANQDIITCRTMVEEFVDTLKNWFKVPVHVVCCTIDYPGYYASDSQRASELYGSVELDNQIQDLWESKVLTQSPILSRFGPHNTSCNIIWSYSIGTRYAAKLCNRRPDIIDHVIFTAPYHTLTDSLNLMVPLWVALDGPNMDGLNILPDARIRQKPRIYAYMGKGDTFFPSDVVLPLVKNKLHEWIVDPTATHRWFTSKLGAVVVATYIGMRISIDHHIQESSQEDLSVSQKSEV
jgi:hypothetical protein